GLDHRGPVRVPVAAEVEAGEGFEFRFPLHQLSEGFAGVGQISPTVTDALPAWISDARQRTVRRDHALRKPIIAGFRAKEIAEADDQRAHSMAGRLFQLPLQRDAYGPLVRSRTLR